MGGNVCRARWQRGNGGAGAPVGPLYRLTGARGAVSVMYLGFSMGLVMRLLVLLDKGGMERRYCPSG